MSLESDRRLVEAGKERRRTISSLPSSRLVPSHTPSLVRRRAERLTVHRQSTCLDHLDQLLVDIGIPPEENGVESVRRSCRLEFIELTTYLAEPPFQPSGGRFGIDVGREDL